MHRRQVDQTFDPVGREAPLVFVKLGARNAALFAGSGDIPRASANASRLKRCPAILI
jgi:hypothetical protein